jgi:hypothetical protein
VLLKPAAPPPFLAAIPKRGWKIIGAGIGIVVMGFLVLSFTDPQGQNFASHLSPFLILGGYAVIGFGILAKDSPRA